MTGHSTAKNADISLQLMKKKQSFNPLAGILQM